MTTDRLQKGAVEEVRLERAEWLIRPQTQAVFSALNREGFEARAVGGAVRNTLMARPVADIDLAATARPEDITRLAQDAGLKAVPTGISHGTVTVVADGMPFEVTTLRRDVDTDGRHAAVTFTTDWAEDAGRRDFTLNALYADADGRVHDPLGGLPDLLAGRVRFIGKAEDRIREDYLRILRFFRFSAEYGAGSLDRDGLSACTALRDGLRRLSAERVRAELLKLIVADHAAPILEAMEDSGILLILLGGMTLRARMERLAAIEKGLGLPPKAMRHLAALAVLVREDAERLAERLRLSNAEAEALTAMAERHRFRHRLQQERADALLYRLGQRTFIDLLLLAWADASGTERAVDWRGLYARAAQWEAPRFPLSGGDLLARGFQPGPELGTILRALESAWIDSGFKLTRDELLAKARVPRLD